MNRKRSQPWTVISVLLILISISLLVRCDGKDSDKDGIIDKKDKCVDVKGPKPNGCPIITKLGTVHLYLETSASMGGYLNGAADFKQVISDLAVKVDKEISPLKIHFISDSITDYQFDAAKFTSDIATTKVTLARSSELHNIFDQVAKATKAGEISILVSDCILSFPNKEVKKNSQVNIESSGTLKNHIYSTFIDLKNRGQAASLYAFSSAFFGTYYDYQNVKKTLPGTQRPFYVWVIAKNNVLPIFDDKLNQIPNFKPEQELHFGLLDKKVKSYRILTELNKKGHFKLIKTGKAAVSDIGIENVESKSDQDIAFSAVIDLHELPSYARKLSYLKENLKVEAKGCSAVVKIMERSPTVHLKSKRQRAYYEEASHEVIITIKQLRLENATLNLSVPLKYDSWYKDWSTMDDKDVKNLGKKTFSLVHLVDGVMEAYNNKGEDFIDLKFQINQ